MVKYFVVLVVIQIWATGKIYCCSCGCGAPPALPPPLVFPSLPPPSVCKEIGVPFCPPSPPPFPCALPPPMPLCKPLPPLCLKKLLLPKLKLPLCPIPKLPPCGYHLEPLKTCGCF